MREFPDHYGCHRSLLPAGGFPQSAERLDPSLPIYENEILIAVERLNIDAASFQQMKKKANGLVEGIRQQIAETVHRRGKMHNPVTNSGGVLLGTIAELGKKASGKGFSVGDRVATLVSLTLTPLHLAAIEGVEVGKEQVQVKGHAILFASGAAHRLPPDFSEAMALAIFDVCGAPALTSHLEHVGETVVILGAGKAGVLAAAASRNKVGTGGKIYLLDKDPLSLEAASRLSFIDSVAQVDATDPKGTMETVRHLTHARMADLVVNCAPVPGTEAASILAAKRTGTVLFFNMATSFQSAVLAAEGMGHETGLMMGNGYFPGHAELAIRLVRESPELRAWFEKRFG